MIGLVQFTERKKIPSLLVKMLFYSHIERESGSTECEMNRMNKGYPEAIVYLENQQFNFLFNEISTFRPPTSIVPSLTLYQFNPFIPSDCSFTFIPLQYSLQSLPRTKSTAIVSSLASIAALAVVSSRVYIASDQSLVFFLVRSCD